jgi:TrpR-related protein YerC/YecD
VDGMPEDKTSVWKRESSRQLAEALSAIGDVETMENFLRDVMTEKEIIEIGSRLEAARLLKSGSTYNDIVARTNLSTRTIARISDWMQNGCSGYAAALERINHHNHISPARSG